jgi:hypothetical protein
MMPKTALAMGRQVQRTGHPQAVKQLPDEVTISVTELSCREPGCPDVETVVAILREAEKPTIARIHKTIPDVTPDELKTAFELALAPRRLAC